MTNNKNYKNEDLLLYIISKLEDCPNNGAVLLNKILYYIDSIHYLKYGRPVSSFAYIKQENGPTPAPADFMPLRERLIKDGHIEMQEKEHLGYIQKKLTAKKQFDISYFGADELALIDMVIEDCKPFTASKISHYSHQEMAWKLASKFEELPLYTFLLSQSEIEEDDVKWARETIRNRATV